MQDLEFGFQLLRFRAYGFRLQLQTGFRVERFRFAV